MSVFPDQALLNAIDATAETYSVSDRYLILLDNTPRVVQPTINTTTNVLSTVAANTLVTGCRIRVSSTGTLPNLFGGLPVDTQQDYYVNAITTTTSTLHLTLDDANSDVGAVDFISAGTGTLSLTEQPFTPKDAPAAIISRELTHPEYSRLPVELLGSAVIVSQRAVRGPIPWRLESKTGSPTLTAGWVVMLTGAIATVRNSDGEIGFTKVLDPILTILPGVVQVISLTLAAL